MTGLRNRPRGALFVAAALCAGLAGCTNHSVRTVGISTGSFRLVAFDSCADALDGLRAAAKSVVGPYGFGGGPIYAMDGSGGPVRSLPVPTAGRANSAPEAKSNAGASTADSSTTDSSASTDFSSTNTHEAGVDEPDLVKTDGRRIVTVSNGVLRVIDANRKAITATLNLADPSRPQYSFAPADMLLAGDHALVLVNEYGLDGGPMTDVAPGPAVRSIPVPAQVGPTLILVDLSGGARIVSRARTDGNLVDARQVGATARVVVRSNPRIDWPVPPEGTEEDRVAANKAAIDAAGIEAWVPRIDVTTGGKTVRTPVNCDAISRPTSYSGTSMLTVLTFDLNANALGDGMPTSILADGDTVYSNGPSLYVASNQSWRVPWMGKATVPADFRTEIYKFDTPAARRPTFVAGGSVPGRLINQYAMSEWDGKLRVASTVDATWAPAGQQSPAQSGVYVLATSGGELRQVGAVEGLGKGERLYSVRFAGPVGYVVTFRQTDPLFALDLSDPTQPVVRGELKISGYSAYLHPTDADRLIGIGQDATAQGRVTGLQVSLFDVGDLANPSRIAQYKVSGAHSEAEFDPHAFLYWPKDGMLVVPLQASREMGALVLRVGAGSITEVGFVTHPASRGYLSPIRRSLVIDTTLWTVSDNGLLASDSASLAKLAWIPFG